MAEYTLAIDVGDGFHGWCLGDVAEHPPRIVAAGMVGHGAALRCLGGSSRVNEDAPVPIWGARQAPPRASLLRHPPILERFVLRGDRIFQAGANALEQGGELAGAWYSATGTKVVKTDYAETCRGMFGTVLKGADAFDAACTLYGAPAGGGKRNRWIGTKGMPGQLRALDPTGMYPSSWGEEGRERNHHRDAFLALLWWAYRRRKLADV